MNKGQNNVKKSRAVSLKGGDVMVGCLSIFFFMGGGNVLQK